MSAEHNGRVTVVDVTTEEGSVIAVEVTLGDSEVVLSGHPQGSEQALSSEAEGLARRLIELVTGVSHGN